MVGYDGFYVRRTAGTRMIHAENGALPGFDER